jgi:hypothetical protein
LAEFGHFDDQDIGGDVADARDAGEDLISLLDIGIGASQLFLLLVDGVDLGVDLAQALGKLALDEG